MWRVDKKVYMMKRGGNKKLAYRTPLGQKKIYLLQTQLAELEERGKLNKLREIFYAFENV